MARTPAERRRLRRHRSLLIAALGALAVPIGLASGRTAIAWIGVAALVYGVVAAAAYWVAERRARSAL